MPASGLLSPYGLAVDNAGDVFIADAGGSRVWRSLPVAAPRPRWQRAALPPWRGSRRRGRCFHRRSRQQPVVEVPSGGGAQTTVASGLYAPAGVALDGAGDVFIADAGNNRVVEVPAGGGAQTTVVSGLHYPYRVAVDGAGDVFIADTGQRPGGRGSVRRRHPDYACNGLRYPTVSRWMARAISLSRMAPRWSRFRRRIRCQITVAHNGLIGPFGVAVDGAGDVFIADDFYNQRAVEVQRVAVEFRLRQRPAHRAQTTRRALQPDAHAELQSRSATTFGLPAQSAHPRRARSRFHPGQHGTCTGTASAAGTPARSAFPLRRLRRSAPGRGGISTHRATCWPRPWFAVWAWGRPSHSPGVQITVPSNGLIVRTRSRWMERVTSLSPIPSTIESLRFRAERCSDHVGQTGYRSRRAACGGGWSGRCVHRGYTANNRVVEVPVRWDAPRPR